MMINFSNVTKIFKSDLLSRTFIALDNVSFNIPAGSMVGFLGANGAGKTTALKIIMDFTRPSAGKVEFGPQLGQSQAEIFKNIGYLPERPYFYPHLTGEDFLIFMGKLSDMKTGDIRHEMKKWADRFKIEYALKRELKTYSKGMLQRIGFMATILHQPKFIILDEPLSGLDPIGRKELKDVIIEVHKDGKTVFFSSHIVSDVEEICDRVIFLKEGKLIYNGSVSNLISSDSQRDYTVTVQGSPGAPSSITYKSRIDLPDNVMRFIVSPENKDRFIVDSISNGQNIIGLEMVKPSLEEIFYHTQGDR